jgi:hypothetical protein
MRHRRIDTALAPRRKIKADQPHAFDIKQRGKDVELWRSATLRDR